MSKIHLAYNGVCMCGNVSSVKRITENIKDMSCKKCRRDMLALLKE
jgi:hypothetical protein